MKRAIVKLVAMSLAAGPSFAVQAAGRKRSAVA